MIDSEARKKLEEVDFSEIPAITDDHRNKVLEILTDVEKDSHLTELIDHDKVVECTQVTMQGRATNCDLRVNAVEEYKKNMIAFQRKARVEIENIAKAPDMEQMMMGKSKMGFFDKIRSRFGGGQP